MQIKRILAILVFIFLASTVFSLSMGPGRVEYLYKPGLSGQFELTVTENAGQSIDLVVYAEGDLAEYVKINDPNFHLEAYASKTISYSFALPNDLNRYGRNETLIIAKTTIPKKDRTSTIAAAVAIAHQFWVHVPYPYVYVEPRIKAENVTLESVQRGDPVFLDVTLFNLGSEDSNSKVNFFITSAAGEKVHEFEQRAIEVKKGEQQTLQYDWYPKNPKTIEPGSYTANAVVDYGGKSPSSAAQEFKIGTAIVVPKSVKVNSFELGQIAKVEIILESQWSSKIPGVYAKVLLLNEKGEAIRSPPQSATVNMEPWMVRTVEVFIDTAGLEKKKYDLNVIVYFSNRETSGLFDFDTTMGTVQGGGNAQANTTGFAFDSIPTVIIAIVLIIAGLAAAFFIFYFRRSKK